MTDLGRDVANAIGSGPSASRQLAQRERLVRAASASASSSRRWPAIVAAMAGAVVLGVLASVYLMAEDVEAPESVADARGEWVQAPASGALAYDLGDGTSVRWVESASGRLTPGRISLESGRVEAEVEPAAGQRWTVEAGPYEVIVVGTVFAVNWDPASTDLEVEVIRGEVKVTGGPIGEQQIGVSGGNRLRANHRAKTVNLGPRAKAAPPPKEDAPDVDVEPVPEPELPAKGSAPRPRPSWKTEASGGNYREALDRAKKRGFDRMVRTLGKSDLRLLADTARLATDRPRAKQAYAALRKRFKGSTEATRAAFHLGRLSAASGGAAAEAARSFETYLRESPRGAYAREARGRLVQAYNKAGNKAAARKAAKRYLELYPTGPYAPLCRKLVPGSP